MGDWPSNVVIQPKTAIATWSKECLGPTVAGLSTATSTITWPAVNRALYIPFTLDVPFLAQKMVWLNGPTLNGNVDVGIFEPDGKRLVSLGSTAQAGVSLSQVGDIADTLLNPGTYYMCLASDSATATFSGVTALGAVVLEASGVKQQALAGLALATNANPAVFAAPAAALVPSMSVIGVATV